MFQGERALYCSCTADRVLVVWSVKYDWKKSISLCDLWNLLAMFIIHRHVCAILHCSVPFAIFFTSAQYCSVQFQSQYFFHVCAILHCSVPISIFFTSVQYYTVQFQSQYFFHVCAILHCAEFPLTSSESCDHISCCESSLWIVFDLSSKIIWLDYYFITLSRFPTICVFDKYLSLVDTCHAVGTVCLHKYCYVPFFPPTVRKKMWYESNESPVFLLSVRDLFASTNVCQIDESLKQCGICSLVFLYNVQIWSYFSSTP